MNRERLCQACRRGRIDPQGYATDGRPRYTCGHNGHDWDSRTRLPVCDWSQPRRGIDQASPEEGVILRMWPMSIMGWRWTVSSPWGDKAGTKRSQRSARMAAKKAWTDLRAELTGD